MSKTIDEIMNEIPKEWRYNWCKSKLCCCRGCANVSGKLIKLGFTEQDWSKWVEQNPESKVLEETKDE